MNATTATGTCLCGAVRFEVRLPTLWCAHFDTPIDRQPEGHAYLTDRVAWIDVPPRP